MSDTLFTLVVLALDLLWIGLLLFIGHAIRQVKGRK